MKKKFFKISNSKGNTLVEVIVSIIIIGIVLVMVLNVFSTTQKTNLSVIQSEQISCEINNLYSIFTENPDSFKNKLEGFGYKIENEKYLYFTDTFQKTNEITKNFIQLGYEKVDDRYYKLTLDVYLNNELDENLTFSKEVLYE